MFWDRHLTAQRQKNDGRFNSIRAAKKIAVMLSVEDVARSLEAALGPGLRYRAAFSVAYGGGLRASEITHLKVGDIAPEARLRHGARGASSTRCQGRVFDTVLGARLRHGARGASSTRCQRRVFDTAGSAMTHHPHVHVIVPGGGRSPDSTRWIGCRPGFFLPVKVLSRLFRRLFLEGLTWPHKAGKLVFFGDLAHLSDPANFATHLAPLRKINWVVYAKPPFGGPKAVSAYLSRDTHPLPGSDLQNKP